MLNWQHFLHPRKEDRPTAFWSWNDRLEPAGLCRQICEMRRQGYGGFFMHSRSGLKTVYLSDDWMNQIAEVLNECRKQDLAAWFYDEDKWPSGFAGGKVCAGNIDYRAKFLLKRMIAKEDLERSFSDPCVKAVFAVQFNSASLISYQRLHSADCLSESGSLLEFRVQTQTPGSRYNGEAYADILSPEVVERFLDLTHRKYQKLFRRDFGEFLPGFFTDEPCCTAADGHFASLQNKGPLPSLPWSLDFEKYFQSLKGYDLLDELPLLFYPAKQFCRIRIDYFSALTQRFVEAYTQKIYQFCEENQLQSTGHFLAEDNLVSQALTTGAVMPHYAHMHMPGIDHLLTDLRNPLTLKQCASVAHQFGRAKVLSEMYGASGYAMTFKDQKWVADFHFALGINFVCKHLLAYSLAGDRKRDYPPTFSFHQPCAEFDHFLNDYLARCSWLNSQGNYLAETLLLHPVASAWATYDLPEADNLYDAELKNLQEILLSQQIAFDYGDEMIMRQHASISGPGCLKVVQASYRVILVPPSLTWSQNTFKLLQDFARSGGNLIFVGTRPQLIDGYPADADWERLLDEPSCQQTGNTPEELLPHLRKWLTHEIMVKTNPPGAAQQIRLNARKAGSEYVIFLANLDRDHACQAEIQFPFCGELRELNLQNGDQQTQAVDEHNCAMSIKTSFSPAGSRAYVIDSTRKPHCIPDVENWNTANIIQLPEYWKFQRRHDNVLVLDSCLYSMNHERTWSNRVPVWKLRRKLIQEAGLEDIRGTQPYVLAQHPSPGRVIPVSIRFQFRSILPESQTRLQLLIEQARNWQLQVNSCPVSNQPCRHYLDKAFDLLEIGLLLKKGINTIQMDGHYQYGTDLENISLLGDFAVQPFSDDEFQLTAEPDSLQNGSWVSQGYPFYSGSMLYQNQFRLQHDPKKRYLLQLSQPRGTLFLVQINQQKEICLFSDPWETDITEYCCDGMNNITIQVVSSLRNLFGPLHHREQKITGKTGPAQFTDEKNWIPAYQFEDYGLLDGAVILEQSPCP